MFVDSISPCSKVLRCILRLASAIIVFGILAGACVAADEPASAPPLRKEQVLVRDITTIEGVRDNALIGYGLVIGLHGTGDRLQTLFTTQTLANIMQRMGVQIPAPLVRVNNVASVFVTASLPPFAEPGVKLDVTVSSIGDAKSLEGGVLLLTPLHGPDGQVYADAQGPLTLGGYSASGGAGNSKQVNHTTVGRIAEGANVEKEVAIDLSRMRTVSLMLRDPDFTASIDIAGAINKSFGKDVASAVDSRRIDINVANAGLGSVPQLISRVQNLAVTFHPPAKVVVDERTGTIVMGGDVKLSAVAILHGNLSIEVTTQFAVSQPTPFSKNGDTAVVPETTVKSDESAVGKIQLSEGASVEDLVNGLHAAGATARDVVAIIEAIKAAGGLRADLEVM